MRERSISVRSPSVVSTSLRITSIPRSIKRWASVSRSTVAVIVSVTVLGEPVTAPQLAGGALILGFTLWNELPEKK